jgi:hypothetical protein
MAIRLGELGKIWEALGPVNRYYAYRYLGHEPSTDEAITYFYFHTGPHYTVHVFEVLDAETGAKAAEVPETSAQAA